jgi:hypothetical protein
VKNALIETMPAADAGCVYLEGRIAQPTGPVRLHRAGSAVMAKAADANGSFRYPGTARLAWWPANLTGCGEAMAMTRQWGSQG